MTKKRARILVVDDEMHNRDVLERQLRRDGHVVSTAPDGSSALALLEKARFDLVLLDINMPPGIDGNEVLRVIRRAHGPTELPVIMVTGNSDADDVVASLELGANDHVAKPYNLPVLLARVRTQLGLSAAARETRLRPVVIERGPRPRLRDRGR